MPRSPTSAIPSCGSLKISSRTIKMLVTNRAKLQFFVTLAKWEVNEVEAEVRLT